MPKKTLSIVIVSYNRKEDLERCLRSVRMQTIKPKEIIIVDNNSTDGTHEMLKKKFPEVKLLVLPENLGLCTAVNVGFANVNTDYVGIVENDMTISKNWVEEAIKEFEKNPKAGIVCPYFLHWSKHGWVDCEYETEDDWLHMNNGSFIARKDIFKKAGQTLYDPKYFLYAQEEEITARVFNLGYGVKRLRTAMTFHKPRVSKGRMRNTIWEFYQMRNNLWNLWTFYSARNVIVFTPIYLLNFLLQIKNPVRFLRILGSAIRGVPYCLKKRQVVKKDRYLKVFANYRHIRNVQKSHYPFDWATGDIDPRYMDRIVAPLSAAPIRVK